MTTTLKQTVDVSSWKSQVLGEWAAVMHAALPEGLRNSKEWQELLPRAAAAASGDTEREAERAQAILRWMWRDVLPELTQEVRDHEDFRVREDWATMLRDRTLDAAEAVSDSWMDFRNAVGIERVGTAVHAALNADQYGTPAEVAHWAARAAEAASQQFGQNDDTEAAVANYWKSVDPADMLYWLCK